MTIIVNASAKLSITCQRRDVLSSTARFQQHRQAVFTDLDGEVALFQSSSCEYLVLNESGSAIWNALAAKRSIAELCEILLHDFDVSPEQCLADVKAWLAIALEKQVVTALDS
jgi:hypothetical protein